ncbi:hypothetical protein PRIPAC_88116 [Pristionchus pacificus]|uniref:Aldehyde dehydrogenase n=1 Tax=Pristionchus pacificus TaxID=54126 RepID=A0A2A6CYN8_PRIPA|nr:hypothetical protein PRIPAC_88116 [Pristionchus pacificus]|eukprot:PDM83177.1 hypothetical protein PRIPAC_37570 [Pristionchus pacificus]
MSSYTELVKKQRDFYLSGGTADLAGRKKRLEKFNRPHHRTCCTKGVIMKGHSKRLKFVRLTTGKNQYQQTVPNPHRTLLTTHKKELDDSIFADLHRSSFSDVDSTLQEVVGTLDNIDAWTAPKKVPVGGPQLSADTDSLYLVPEPLGVVLIISPWNFPLVTSASLAAALAAGNTVIVKPSELDPTFSAVFAKLVAKYFDEKEFAVVEGGIPETTELLKERFDHILYTGCPPVAKIIMAAAAKHLTPVTLELGGKNPVFVDESADLSLLAQGIVFAKLLNAGQICICADYILTTPSMKPKIIAALSSAFDALGDMSKVKENARIVNDRHFQRLMGLLQKTKGKVAYKAVGEISQADKFIPAHLIDVEAEDEFMKEEVFGPLLPILSVPSFDAALDYIKRNEKPLAAYLYTSNKEQSTRFIKETSSGGVTVNGIMTHVFAPGLPFGGVGNSGMGRLHGKYSFDIFSHEKPVCLRSGLTYKNIL